MSQDDKVRRKDSYKDYVDSGVWKCGSSPNGAHHWHIADSKATCYYCKKVEQVVDNLIVRRSSDDIQKKEVVEQKDNRHHNGSNSR